LALLLTYWSVSPFELTFFARLGFVYEDEKGHSLLIGFLAAGADSDDAT
jgi:hypothetical protein